MGWFVTTLTKGLARKASGLTLAIIIIMLFLLNLQQYRR